MFLALLDTDDKIPLSKAIKLGIDQNIYKFCVEILHN